MNKRFSRSAAAAALAMLVSTGVWADDLSPDVVSQMMSISSVKAGFTAAQKKMDSNLAYGILAASNDGRVAAFSNAITPLATTDVNGTPTTPTATSDSTVNFVAVEIFGDVDGIESAVNAAGGKVTYKSANWGAVNASLPVASINAVASSPSVTRMASNPGASTNLGSASTQGTISHDANKTFNLLGVNGSGVKVGVLSDSATAARIATLKTSGDLKATATALPGQNGTGSDEGTAMMEIIQDMAPGADLIFATAFTSAASFADNILALAAAGCKVIVDDISYFNEGVFQDGPIARAVNQVTASGVIYFSSAANSGSLTRGTSGTFEGDFKDGGPVTLSPPVSLNEGGTGRLHSFSPTAAVQNFDALTVSTSRVSLKWSDPLGASSNDYDLYVLNAAGTAILGFSAAGQSGTQDPFEFASTNASGGFPVGSRVVVVLYSGVPRALHVDTIRGALSIATSGSTYGHNAAASTVTMAATYWNSAKTGTKAFTGFPNINEPFSSDGPRKIFYTPTGAEITPGNVLFATNGGTTLQKPDFAAADGVTTRTPGFLPFFGTSAAAPHAAGIAALIRSARPDYTAEQVKTAMRMTALDSMGAGVDRDSGYGIVMAYAAVQYALTH